MTPALLLSDRDNVAVALEPIVAGQAVEIGGTRVSARNDIPSGHKIARLDIGADALVVKYGSPIGRATRAIAAGEHVHTHNLASTRGRGDLR